MNTSETKVEPAQGRRTGAGGGQILFVDDEVKVLSGIRRQLFPRFKVDISCDPEAALSGMARREPYAVVVSDMRMPHMDGIEFLRRVERISPDTVRLMLTGNNDIETALRAVNEGQVFRFLNKPCPPERLETALQDALRQFELVRAEKELLERTVRGSVEVLVQVLELAAPAAFGRAGRVRADCRCLAEALGLGESWELDVAAMLSQLGWVAVPADVLALVESSALNGVDEDARAMIERVPKLSVELVRAIPRLERVVDLIERARKGSAPADDLPCWVLRVALQRAGTIPQGGESALPAPLRDALAVLGQNAPATTSAEEVVEIELERLIVGDVLAAPIVTKDGLPLVREGQKVGTALLERVRNYARVSGVRRPIRIRPRKNRREGEKTTQETRS